MAAPVKAPLRTSGIEWSQSMGSKIEVALADQFVGMAGRDLVIASVASVGLNMEAPEGGVMWRVHCDDYVFEAGLQDGSFYLRRNGQEARTKATAGRIEACSVLFTWSPEWLRVSLTARIAGGDGSASFVDRHELRTPPCLAPNRLIGWARETMLAPVTAYPTEADFRDTVLTAISLLGDTISMTGMQRSFWDAQRDGNSVIARRPKTEPECLPLIHALLASVAIQKSLEIAPEHPSGSGALDFLITGPLTNQERAKACVEFKMAHNDRLEHGLLTQLPEYMRANASDFGI
jgi:hypothetical protein